MSAERLELRKATRSGVKPLVCFYSESGCGKTYSSLLLARGFVGPNGRIGMVDSERGRGSLYADVIPGGYDVIELTDPFSPHRYIEAIATVEESGCTIGVLDSGSHEWEGIGGVLDMAATNEGASGKPGLHNWRVPKMEHAKFVLRLMQSKLPWVVCLRAKFKTRQTKENGRTVIVKDDFTTPLQADDFIFESTVHGEIMQDHKFRLTKCSHPTLGQCFPTDGPICMEHGAKLAHWCQGTATKVTDPAKERLAPLWKLVKPVRGDAMNWDITQAWLAKNRITDKLVKELTDAELSEVMDKASVAISELELV